MRINALYCGCGTPRLKVVPMDHFSSGSCPRPPMPLPRINAVLQRNANDKIHRDGRITVTRTLGCARQVILEDEFDHVVDPRWMNSQYEGIREHEDMAKNAPPGWYAEVTFPRPGGVEAKLFGVGISGTIDLLRADFSAIEEYKKHAESAQYYREKAKREGEIDWELAAQVNMQRLLVLIALGADVPELIGWHGAMCKAGGTPPWIDVRLPRMSEDEISRLRPFGSKYTVQQNVDQQRRYYEQRAQGVSKEDAVRQLPLSGLDMFVSEAKPARGRYPARERTCKCDRYCFAADNCGRIQRGEPVTAQGSSIHSGAGNPA